MYLTLPSPSIAHVPVASRGCVMMVDDDAEILATLAHVLENAKFSVSTCATGQIACATAYQMRPDVILMDWVMPGMDGCMALERLKSDPETSGIPIIVMTSQSGSMDRYLAFEAGAQDFMTKPISTAKLLARIERQLPERRGDWTRTKLARGA